MLQPSRPDVRKRPPQRDPGPQAGDTGSVPTTSWPCTISAEAYQALERYEDAIAAYEAELVVRPNSPEIRRRVSRGPPDARLALRAPRAFGPPSRLSLQLPSTTPESADSHPADTCVTNHRSPDTLPARPPRAAHPAPCAPSAPETSSPARRRSDRSEHLAPVSNPPANSIGCSTPHAGARCVNGGPIA